MADVTVQLNRPQRPHRVAVISDVHGNRHALEAVLTEIDRDPPDEIWCLGDLVGYGAEPYACVEEVVGRATTCLVGNHDLAVTGAFDISEFSHAAADAVRWTREALPESSLARLRTMSPLDTEQAISLYHGSPRDPVWEYVLSAKQAGACLDVQSARVSLVGHSHVALSFHRNGDGQVDGVLRPADTELEIGSGRWLLNPGSVGQPRDGDWRAAWMDLDLDSWTARWHRVAYDVEGAAAAIRDAGLPGSLADRLFVGQ